MKNLHIKKLAVVTGLALACAAGFAQATNLGDNFSVNGAAIAPNGGALGGGLIANVDSANFRYTAIINQANDGGPLNGDAFTESGFLSFSAFNNDAGSAILGSGLNATYAMYALFKATGTAAMQIAGDPASDIIATFSSFAIEMYTDKLGDTTFTPLTTANFPTTFNTSDDDLLASSSDFVVGQAQVAGGLLAKGDFRVDLDSFSLTPFGKSFFPVPADFYKKFFLTGVTTALSGGSSTAPFIANATGSGDLAFKANVVPEPEIMSLMGIGLLGFGFASSKRRIQKQA
jgi:hypothetical protein